MNRNSIVNQEIKRKFVEREVLACVTNMVDYILKKGYENDKEAPFTIDDIENMYVPTCPECGSTSFIKEENEDEETIYICDDCKTEFEEEPDTEPQEVYEWWIVTDWLGEKLKQHGEVVVSDGLNTIWGRGCTGQAILLDGVISDICQELEILEGQKNDWSKLKP